VRLLVVIVGAVAVLGMFPLWNPSSQIIYWWTATEVDSAHALSVTYDGKIWPRLKRFGYDYLGYRCVRAVSANDSLAAPMGPA
jgi:hypothetical protein